MATNNIIHFVKDIYKPWVRTLSDKQIAYYLNIIASVVQCSNKPCDYDIGIETYEFQLQQTHNDNVKDECKSSEEAYASSEEAYASSEETYPNNKETYPNNKETYPNSEEEYLLTKIKPNNRDYSNIMLDSSETIVTTIEPSLQSAINNRNQSSYMLGELSEMAVYDELKSGLPSDMKVTKVSSGGGKGDLLVHWISPTGCSYKLMIDVKNFSKVVPRKEIDKFKRDMQRNQYDSGIILSLCCRFVDMREQTLEFDKCGNSNVCFLQSSNPVIIVEIVMFMLKMCESPKILSSGDIHSSITYIKTQISSLEEMRMNIMSQKLQNDKFVLKLVDNLNSIQLHVRAEIDSIIRRSYTTTANSHSNNHSVHSNNHLTNNNISTHLNCKPLSNITTTHTNGYLTHINNDLVSNDLVSNDLVSNDLVSNDLTSNDMKDSNLTSNDIINDTNAVLQEIDADLSVLDAFKFVKQKDESPVIKSITELKLTAEQQIKYTPILNIINFDVFSYVCEKNLLILKRKHDEYRITIKFHKTKAVIIVKLSHKIVDKFPMCTINKSRQTCTLPLTSNHLSSIMR